MFTGIWRTGNSGTLKVVLAQAVLAPFAALTGWMLAGGGAGLAALYGVVVALAVSAVLAWRERQTMQHPEWDQHRLFKVFIRAGLERLIVLVGLLIVGLGVLKLPPLPMMLGLVLAQFAWLVVATSGQTKKQ